MKTFTKILMAAAAAAMLATGCVNEDPAYKNDPGPTPPDPNAKGYLSLGDMTMRVIIDTQTETQPDDTGDETTKPASRAAADDPTQPDVSGYLVEITDKEGQSVYKSTYAELGAKVTEEGKLELPVGSYTLTVRSEAAEATPAVGWEHPVYGASRDFAIRKNETTPLDEVVCTLSNIKVTFMCSKDLSDLLTPNSTATVSLGAVEQAFAKNETRAAYYLPQEDASTLLFHFEGAFADNTEKPVRVNKNIPNVKAGQWRKISLVITYSDKGDIGLDIEVDNMLEDDEIVIEDPDNPGEPAIPVAPALVWPDHDLTKPFQLKAPMFDAQGNCIEPAVFELSAPNGIESFEVKVTSDNDELTGKLAAVGGPAFDLCAIDASHAAHTLLSGLGFPLGDDLKGATAKSFDLAGAMKLLYPAIRGTHTFAFTMTDAQQMQTPASLTLIVDPDNEKVPPTIVWEGYDIDKQQTVVPGMQIKVNIATQTGISSLKVTIDSDKLTGDELQGVGLIPEFDLCNITDVDLMESLNALGFPVNENIKGKKEASFDISEFASALLMIAQGKNNFTLTVTDEEGQTTIKTLQLYVPEN